MSKSRRKRRRNIEGVIFIGGRGGVGGREQGGIGTEDEAEKEQEGKRKELKEEEEEAVREEA